jgi:ATP-dependent Lon protease
LVRSMNTAFEQFAKLHKKIPQETLLSVGNITDPGQLADTVVGHLPIKLEDKQGLLELIEPNTRLEKLYELLRAR